MPPSRAPSDESVAQTSRPAGRSRPRRPATGRWPPSRSRGRRPRDVGPGAVVPPRPVVAVLSSASATSTTCSVSGRGMRTRRSTISSRVRKGQRPRTYCNGSPAAAATRTPTRLETRLARARRAGTDGEQSGRRTLQASACSTIQRGLGSRSEARRHRLHQLAAPSVPLPGRHPRHRRQSSSSCLPRLSAISASVSSSRSPIRTRSSLCRVSLMRWSVTRFSL